MIGPPSRYDSTMDAALREAVNQARNAGVQARLGEIYRDMAAQISRQRPVCTASGRCCRFDEYGHRLYVTTAEIAMFTDALASRTKAQADPRRFSLRVLSDNAEANAGGCAFQSDAGLCSVHDIRPFGCRIFFCDPAAERWQQDAYEHFHGRIRRLHDELGIPYFYVEWRAALAILAERPTLPASTGRL